MGYPKAAYKLSKPITQSKIIMRQAESVEKPNNVEIESVNI